MQFIENGVISLEFVKSERNLADPFTKGLSKKLVYVRIFRRNGFETVVGYRILEFYTELFHDFSLMYSLL